MNIRTFPSQDVAKETAMALNSLFAKQNGKEFLFLSSGGSSLGLLQYINPDNFGSHSTFCVLDERYSEDPLLNNFTQIKSGDFYKQIKERGAHFIDTKIQHSWSDGKSGGKETINSLATRFENELRAWVTRTNGTIIATVGIGHDAHTSGIMPFPEDEELFQKTFNNESRWVVGYDAKDKNPYRLRITTTIPFFKRINSPIIFITSKDKRQALEKLLDGKLDGRSGGSINKSPCRIWREIPGVEIFTDIII